MYKGKRRIFSALLWAGYSDVQKSIAGVAP